MLQTIHYAIQTYRRDRAGNLVKSKWLPCQTADEARRQAELSVIKRKSAGAVAIYERNSGEFEEGERAITIAAYGDVPAEASDKLPF